MKCKLVLALAAAMLSPSSFAYNCFESDIYKSQMNAIRSTNKSNGERLGVAVKFLQKSRGIGFDEALREVVNYDAGPKVKAYDEQLADIAGKIKNMKPESTEECSDLVQLQREYGDVGVEKITFIVKSITGQDGAVEK